MPRLRERREDIPLLVEHFVAKFNKQLGMNVTNISARAMDYLLDYSWPGNVRDLENAVQRAMIQSGGGAIDVDDLPLRVCGYSDVIDRPDSEELSLDEYVSRYTGIIEKEKIQNALRECGNNRSQAALKLGISRKTLYNKMKFHGLL